jgi:hypothetical protein
VTAHHQDLLRDSKPEHWSELEIFIELQSSLGEDTSKLVDQERAIRVHVDCEVGGCYKLDVGQLERLILGPELVQDNLVRDHDDHFASIFFNCYIGSN